MENKSLPLALGIVMVIALFTANAVIGVNTGIITHHTGDQLVYQSTGDGSNYQSNQFSMTNLDFNNLSYYGDQMNMYNQTQTGDANVITVDTADLTHVPVEWTNITTDPNWPADGKLYGLQIESSATVSGSSTYTKNEFNQDHINDPGFVNGWNNMTNTQPFGPDNYHNTDFQGAASTGDFALVPFMDNGDGNILDTGNILFSGTNTSVIHPMDLPLFGDNMPSVQLDVNVTYTYYHAFSQIIQDANGNNMTVDIYYGMAALTAQTTVNNYYIPLGDQYDPNTPHAPVNLTITLQGMQSTDLMFSRDAATNGMFAGFTTESSFGVSGTLVNPLYEVMDPNTNTVVANTSLSGQFAFSQSDNQAILFKSYTPAPAATGTTPGLNTGDHLHYDVHDRTDINFYSHRVADNQQGVNPQDFNFTTDSFGGSAVSNMDAYISFYTNTADKVGLIMEQQYRDVTLTGFPEDPNGPSLADIGAQLSHIYTVQVLPLFSGVADSGVQSTAQQDVVIPKEDSHYPRMSDIFYLVNDNNNNNNNNGGNDFFAGIYGYNYNTGVNLEAKLSSTETSLALQNINVNGFDYTVVGDNTTYIYGLHSTGNTPYYFPNEGGNTPPPATLYYDFNYNYTDSRVYDNATGALIYKGEGTVYSMNITIVADFGPNGGLITVLSTTVDYTWVNEMSLKEHSVDYQAAQNPADVPADPNANTTTSVEPTNSSEAPGLSLPGFEAPIAVVSIAFVAIYMRKSRYE